MSNDELIWGCQPVKMVNPHSERIRSFCAVNPRLFASSDTNSVVLWNTRTVLARIDLPARAMCAFPGLDSIACYIAGSSFLHFVNLRSPFPVVKHPLSFSNMLIISMRFFERASIFVCSGHGIMISKLTIAQDITQISIERLTVLYPEVKFTNPTIPCFVDFLEIFIVPIGRTLYIHNADGTIHTKLENIVGGEISCVSFFEAAKFIVVGTVNGIMKILRYGNWVTVYEHFFDKEIVSATVFERNFLVVVDSRRTITTIDVKLQSKLQVEPVPFDVECVHVIDQFMVMRSPETCYPYWCHVYTKHYCDVNGDVRDIQRCRSATRAARLVCWTSEDEMLLLEPRTSNPVFHFSTPSLHAVNYLRDMEVADVCLVVTQLGQLMEIDFSQMNKGGQKESLFESLKPDFDGKWMKTSVHSVGHTAKKCIGSFKFESGRFGRAPAVVLSTGKIKIFGERTEQIHTGLNRLVDAVYCAERDIVVMSSVDQCFVFNIEEQELVSTALDVHYSYIRIISSDVLACGSVDGCIQLRSLPNLNILCSTKPCDDNIPMFYNRDDIKGFRSSVIKIDYCETRNAILVFSREAGINVYDMSLQLIKHVEVPFTPSSVCFQDGSGSILIGAYATVFVVDWSNIFAQNLPIVETEFDDFDLRQDGIHTMRVTEVQDEEDGKALFRTKKAEKQDDDGKLHEERFRVSRRSLPNFANWTGSMKQCYKVVEDEDEEIENVVFERLVVDEGAFTKRHFAPERPDDDLCEWTDEKYPNIEWKVFDPRPPPDEQPVPVPLTKDKILEKQIEATKREILAERDRVVETEEKKKPKSPRAPISAPVAPRRISQPQIQETEIKQRTDSVITEETSKAKKEPEKKKTARRVKKDPNEERRRQIEKHYASMVGETVTHMRKVIHREPPARVMKKTPIGPPDIIRKKEPCYTIKMKMSIPADLDSSTSSDKNEPPVDLFSKCYDDIDDVAGRSRRDSDMFTTYRIDGFEQPFAGYRMVCQAEHFKETPKEVQKFGTWKVSRGETLERRKIKGERKPPLMTIRTTECEKRLVAPPEPVVKVIRERKLRLRSDGIGPHHVTVTKY